MAYYDPLITQWPLLTPGTAAVKLAQLNAMTVSGSVPTAFTVTGAQILNAFVDSEFATLPAAAQQNLLILCAPGSNVLNGGAGTFLQTMLLRIFTAGASPLTRANLAALAKAFVQPWWQANGYRAPINPDDLIAAGDLT